MLFNEIFGWGWILCGFIAGAIIGLQFHREEWNGGYNSHQRRLFRLMHIAFIGTGILNILFSYSLERAQLAPNLIMIASYAFVVGGVMMPLCCGLMAWKKPFRHLFFIPVVSLSSGVVLILGGLL